ncbi:MAG: hypothetical protein ABSG31_17225 [Tepidisphaeraceae bacterium]|jgi:hypothetical protein
MGFFKTIVGKIVAGLVALAVVAAGISWWQMDSDTRQMLVDGTGRIFAWFGIVLALPWVSFSIIGWVAGKDSNAAGGVLVGIYAIAETVLLAWLFHWKIVGSAGWTFLILGGLVAGVYNLLICDWIAEKVV